MLTRKHMIRKRESFRPISQIKMKERSVQRHGSLLSASSYQSVYFTQKFLILKAWIIVLNHESHRWLPRFAARVRGVPNSRGRKDTHMSPYQPYLGPVVALVAGILILIQPGLLSLIVAIYLIATGILGLMGARPTGRWW